MTLWQLKILLTQHTANTNMLLSETKNLVISLNNTTTAYCYYLKPKAKNFNEKLLHYIKNTQNLRKQCQKELPIFLYNYNKILTSDIDSLNVIKRNVSSIPQEITKIYGKYIICKTLRIPCYITTSTLKSHNSSFSRLEVLLNRERKQSIISNSKLKTERR